MSLLHNELGLSRKAVVKNRKRKHEEKVSQRAIKLKTSKVFWNSVFSACFFVCLIILHVTY